MNGKRIYLDNCCYNRPFDDQSQIKILLETKAKLYIQEQILQQSLQLVWSYALKFENDNNPYPDRKENTALWEKRAAIRMDGTMKTDNEIRLEGFNFLVKNMSSVDAERYIAILQTDKFDYTQWRTNLFNGLSAREISRMAMQSHQKN